MDYASNPMFLMFTENEQFDCLRDLAFKEPDTMVCIPAASSLPPGKIRLEVLQDHILMVCYNFFRFDVVYFFV